VMAAPSATPEDAGTGSVVPGEDCLRGVK